MIPVRMERTTIDDISFICPARENPYLQAGDESAVPFRSISACGRASNGGSIMIAMSMQPKTVWRLDRPSSPVERR